MEARPLRHPQLAKEPLLTSRLSGNPVNRVWAKVLDLALVKVFALVLGIFWTESWWVLPVVLLSLSDRIGRGQSPGKWLLGLHTIETHKGMRPGFTQCFIRNFPFMLLLIAFEFQGVWGMVLMLPALAWIAMEVYFIFNIKSTIRAGDILSNTRVFDYKDEHTKFIEQFLKEEPTV
jgi:hypothetical protein